MAGNLYMNTGYDGGLASSYAPTTSYAPRRSTLLDSQLGLDTRSTAPRKRTLLDSELELRRQSTSPESSAVLAETATGTGGPEKTLDKPEATGMSRTMANSLAGAEIGLGLLGYLENRKTGKLQREALRHDIDTAKEHRANRAALGESWNNAWKK